MAVERRRATCSGDRLAFDAWLVLQRHHDGADHGDQQNDAGGLEEVDIAGVEHEPERLGVGDVGRNRRGDRLRHAGRNHPGDEQWNEFNKENERR